jgi:cyclic nucleotide gated channel beta 1
MAGNLHSSSNAQLLQDDGCSTSTGSLSTSCKLQKPDKNCSIENDEESNGEVSQVTSSSVKSVAPHDESSTHIDSTKKLWPKFSIPIYAGGTFYLWWMCLMFAAYSYNAISIPLRASFPQYQGTNFTPSGHLTGPPCVDSVGILIAWLVMDFIVDVVYIIDTLCVQSRVIRAKKMEKIENIKLKDLWWSYVCSWYSWCDFISLIPFDVLYAVQFLQYNPLLRLTKLLRIRHVLIFWDLLESSIGKPLIVRVLKIISKLMYMIHVYACIYHGMSARQGYNTDSWVYDGMGISYLRCFYRAVVIVGAIHDINIRTPNNEVQLLYDTFGHLFGVFFIAHVIGEIANIYDEMNLDSNLRQMKRHRIKMFMETHKRVIPKIVHERVKMWSDYTFSYHKIYDESKILRILPRKLRLDIALEIHLEMLRKVEIFQGFGDTLLREIVLKLCHVPVLDEEYICKKGEIGREMYIVHEGQMIAVDDNNVVIAIMGPGSCFGEISLYELGEGNKRTAHVRSKGYSSLFSLSKKDLDEVLEDFPKAQEILMKKGRNRLHRDKERKSQVVNSAVPTAADRPIRRRREGSVKDPNIVIRMTSNASIDNNDNDDISREVTTAVVHSQYVPMVTISQHESSSSSTNEMKELDNTVLSSDTEDVETIL